MATSTSRVLLLKQQLRSKSSLSGLVPAHTRCLHRQCLGSSPISRPFGLNTVLSPWVAPTTSPSRSTAATLHYQQRRHYIFFPSDWTEFKHRWNLFWKTNTSTIQIKLKWQDRRARLTSERSKLQARLQSQQVRIKANYQFQKLRLQRRYRLNRDYLQRRYQETKLLAQQKRSHNLQKYREASAKQRTKLQQRRTEFTKRWSARRKDMLQDGTDIVKGYFRRQRTRTEVFTLEEYARPHWFDSDGRPLASKDPTGRFVNPWLSETTNGVNSLVNIIKWRYKRAIRQWNERGIMSFLPKDPTQLLLGSALATADPTGSSSNTVLLPARSDPAEIQFTWIGHSTCLVRIGNATVLTDPIFSHRCTPFPRLPGVGVARDTPPSMGLKDLPEKIDVCLITHDHFDHLDYLSVKELRDRVQHWVLPKGLPQWLESRCSVDPTKMTELEWWESVHFVYDSSQDQWKTVTNSPIHHESSSSSTMTVTCCPAQHWSSRSFFDRCKRLWCGFAVETRTASSSTAKTTGRPVVQKFFFAGDSGMPRNEFPLFSQIGDFCGRGLYHRQHPKDGSSLPQELEELPFHPFDLAAIPIGAYDPSYLMQDAHMDPREAVQCAQQLRARKSVAIHWGTFALSEEPMEEPPLKLQEALDDENNKKVDFVTLPIGGSLCVAPTTRNSSSQEEKLEAIVSGSEETSW